MFMNWHRSSSHAAAWCGSPGVGTTFGTPPNLRQCLLPTQRGLSWDTTCSFPTQDLKNGLAWCGARAGDAQVYPLTLH